MPGRTTIDPVLHQNANFREGVLCVRRVEIESDFAFEIFYVRTLSNIGGIHIDRDPTGPTMQTLAMAFNDPVRQRFRHAQEFLAIRSIFKTRQSRL
jgi:hypothetical protein